MSLTRTMLIAAATAIAGCSGMPERPVLPDIDHHAAFGAPAPQTAATREMPWWETAVDEQSRELVRTAIASSPALRESAQQLAAAEAALAQAQADLGPSATLDADASLRDDGADTTDAAQLGVDARLPIDINGALDQRREAARARLDERRATLSLRRGELARDYLLSLADYHEAGERSRLLNEQLEVADTLLRLIELRFTQGLASSVDVLQQRDQRAALRQQLPVAARDQWTASNDLRRLTGQVPGTNPLAERDTLPEISDTFALVEPAQLSLTRADLRASAARVAAADASFAAALADRLPTLTLTSGAVRRVVSGDYSTVLSAALGAVFTLFDSGNLRAIAEERRADLAALGERYLIDWLDAVFEVDDLMFERTSLQERLDLSSQRLQSAQQLLDAAQRRYERGVSDYLPVLEALRGLQQQQRADLALRAELARTRIRLHQALGDSPAQPANPVTMKRSYAHGLEVMG